MVALLFLLNTVTIALVYFGQRKSAMTLTLIGLALSAFLLCFYSLYEIGLNV